MKKLFAGPVLFVLTVILLSSCGNSSKLTITKRHYRSGYYVNFGSKNQTTTSTLVVKAPSIKDKQPTIPVVSTKPESYTNANIPITVIEKSPIVAKTVAPKKMRENNIVSSSSTLVTQKILIQNTRANNDILNSVGGYHDQENIRVSFLIIVLCAIFIPPLGVALMYGINSYFWIDLILTLLFFFPGMIFALIVTLM